MTYAVATIHGAAYTRIFTPKRYLPDGFADGQREVWLEAVKAEGRKRVDEAFAVVEQQLGENGRLFGDHLTVADAALFYVTFWADHLGLTLPPRCQAFHRGMRERPVVRRVLAEEGYR